MEFVKGELLIRDNTTGEVRRCEFGVPKQIDGDSYRLLWQEGNFSCDCNRRLFFEQAGGEENEIDAEIIMCGDGGFSVVVTSPDGKTLYSDMDKPD